MSLKTEKAERENEKAADRMETGCPEPLKITKAVYGTEELRKCMESVIRLQKGCR